jgi:hypothetical protein
MPRGSNSSNTVHIEVVLNQLGVKLEKRDASTSANYMLSVAGVFAARDTGEACRQPAVYASHPTLPE